MGDCCLSVPKAMREARLKDKRNTVLTLSLFIYRSTRRIEEHKTIIHMAREILFFKEETRLAILCLLIDIHNHKGSTYDCIDFDYIESVANKFELLDKIGVAAYLNTELACNILANEKNEIIWFFRDMIKYLIATEYTKDKSKSYSVRRYEPDYIRRLLDKINPNLQFGVSYQFKEYDPFYDFSEAIRFYNIKSNDNLNENAGNKDLLYKDL